LEHHAKEGAKVLSPHVARVVPVNEDPSVIDVVEAKEQVDEGGLPTPRGAYKGNGLARLSLKRDVLEKGTVGNV
jgi:hypothetical protein